MPYEFRLPDLGEGIAEVELRRWLVREGDRVAEHQTVLEVESDKAVVEVPTPRAGIVARLLRREGETVKVGEPLLAIAAQGEEVSGRPKSVGIVGVLPEEEEEPAPPPVEQREVRATPMVRKLARERGIDLTTIRGSGPHGSVTPEDLEPVAQPVSGREEPSGPVERLPLRGVRRTIARHLGAAQQLTAFVTTMDEADMTDLWKIRNREQQEVEAHHGTHLTFLPFFIKAAQHALREHPYLNGSIDDAAQEIVLKRHYHFGIAVETEEGLMVPVIRDVDKKSILDLAEEIQQLGKKARERTISLDELKGSTFTITNYGHFGGTYATPIINWPDVAILGCGRIAEKPWVHRGAIAIRRIVSLSLTFDHRVTDGADAALFLGKVVRYLEDPALLFLEGT
ncbi:dihydrolipoamide acetyltransferase family protein [Geobacter argillaceus]|uniref:Dihydrolipoamide acetyltransferase component of pyruvate dehydrogenase complex n=1 Tax=Geobacter argillaceus TaxID=345631 RepID=A0A562VKB3_9BACT|nr:dihydrolipoamide acetyltransferase family protein [Geobacter argillaceus]TWJ18251.1 pyruvate dehydrogenase E2 component (dihydrolipoamide acetyltransferase) [Geobacter argillaceus]